MLVLGHKVGGGESHKVDFGSEQICHKGCDATHIAAGKGWGGGGGVVHILWVLVLDRNECF